MKLLSGNSNKTLSLKIAKFLKTKLVNSSIKKFIKQDKKNIIFFKKNNNKNYFNLSKYIHFQLKSLNIKKIDIINKDTFTAKNNFFSARRSISRNENDYGRNISIIMIN